MKGAEKGGIVPAQPSWRSSHSPARPRQPIHVEFHVVLWSWGPPLAQQRIGDRVPVGVDNER